MIVKVFAVCKIYVAPPLEKEMILDTKESFLTVTHSFKNGSLFELPKVIGVVYFLKIIQKYFKFCMQIILSFSPFVFTQSFLLLFFSRFGIWRPENSWMISNFTRVRFSVWISTQMSFYWQQACALCCFLFLSFSFFRKYSLLKIWPIVSFS